MFKKILVVLMFMGLGIFIVGLALTKGDFSKTIAAFTTEEDYEYKEFSSEETINSIVIDLVNNNINILKSEDESIYLNYYESEHDMIEYNIKNEKLSVIGKQKNRFTFFSFRIKPNKLRVVNVYLPKSFEGNVEIELTSGKLEILDYSLNKVDIELTSGEVSLTNINANNLTIKMTSGDTILENVNVEDNLKLNITSGSIKTNKIKSNNLITKITSGTAKFLETKANNLDVDITSGNFNLDLIGLKEDYSADIDVTSGDVYYDGVKLKSQKLNEGKQNLIKIDVTSGDIKIKFINE